MLGKRQSNKISHIHHIRLYGLRALEGNLCRLTGVTSAFHRVTFLIYSTRGVGVFVCKDEHAKGQENKKNNN